MTEESILQCAAFVCAHVADGAPILYAHRDRSQFPEDSGWQFLCGGMDHDEASKAQIWAIHEVLELDNSLRRYISEPPEIELKRTSENHGWVLSRTG